MRGFSLGAIALAAACSSDGVYLEVRVPAGMTVDQVELYLATQDCDGERAGFDCQGIVPPSGQLMRERVEGEVYFVDDNRPFVSPPDEAGSAWFHLDPSSELDLKTAIAVGRDPRGLTGVAIFQEIKFDRAQHVRIDLESVASETIAKVPQPAVEVWGPNNNDYRCVAAAVGGRVVYIVPEDDPDCDQVVASNGEECLPGVYLGSENLSPDLRDQSCATTENSGLCVLGGRICDERTPDAGIGACISNPAATYCVPDRV